MKYNPEMKALISKAVEKALKETPTEKLKEFSWFSTKEERAYNEKETK